MAAYDYRDCFNGVSLFLLSDVDYLSYRYYPYRSTIFLARVKIIKGTFWVHYWYLTYIFKN